MNTEKIKSSLGGEAIIKTGSLLVIMTLFFLQTVTAAERESVDEQLEASAIGLVEIEVVRGNLTIRGWDKNVVRVAGRLDEQTREFVFDRSGDLTRIAVKLPRHTSGNREGSNLEVHLPVGSEVSVSVVSADVRAEDIAGRLAIATVSGDINTGKLSGRVELSTVSGEVDVRNVDGRLSIRTVSGDIDSRDVAGESGLFHTVSGRIRVENGNKELDLASVSGDIEVENTQLSHLKGSSISGDLDLKANFMKGGVLEFDTVSGEIRLRLAEETDAHFDLETGAGGDIRNRLTADKVDVSRYSRNQSLRFVMGDGEGEVILSTASGDIVLSN